VLFEIDNVERHVHYYDVFGNDDSTAEAAASLLWPSFVIERRWQSVSDEIATRSIEQDCEHDSGVWLLVALWHRLRQRELPRSLFASERTRYSLAQFAVYNLPSSSWVPQMCLKPLDDAPATMTQLPYGEPELVSPDALAVLARQNRS